MQLKFTQSFVLIILIAGLTVSCSTNSFNTRKNFHSRVQVDIHRDNPTNESLVCGAPTSAVKVYSTSEPVSSFRINKVNKPLTDKGKKTGFTEKVISTFYPGLKSSFQPLFEYQSRKLHKVTKPSMDSDQVAGLILGILSLASAITAGLMIIGMASGNIWVYFALGMTFAVIAIVLGAVGKLFRYKGLSIAGLTIGIVVVVALLVMLVVFTVLGIL